MMYFNVNLDIINFFKLGLIENKTMKIKHISFVVLTILIIIALSAAFLSTKRKLKDNRHAIKQLTWQVNSLSNYVYKESFAAYNESFNDGKPVAFDQLMDEVTIIVPSFDKYSELWNPFFFILI